MSDEEPTTPVVITPAVTRVEITSGGHQVVVEAAGRLRTIAGKALELWRATDDRALTRGYGTSVGFHTELGPEAAEDDEGMVGFRVT